MYEQHFKPMMQRKFECLDGRFWPCLSSNNLVWLAFMQSEQQVKIIDMVDLIRGHS